jgi:centromeric protein E
MLQPSLAGNARVSVICTLNGSTSAIGETTSTLGFATRIKKVQVSRWILILVLTDYSSLSFQLHAVKKEVIDTDALLERYRKEIEELKARLEERERDAPARNRRLSARQVGFC